LAPCIKSASRGAGRRQPSLQTVAANSGDVALVAKEYQMPEYRPDVPSVDVFTADELLVLSEWFGVVLSRSEELALWSRRVVRPSGLLFRDLLDARPRHSASIIIQIAAGRSVRWCAHFPSFARVRGYAQLDRLNAPILAVDSHHPSPASQHVSSGSSGARRRDCTGPPRSRRNAAARRRAIFGSRAPLNSMNPAGRRKRAA